MPHWVERGISHDERVSRRPGQALSLSCASPTIRAGGCTPSTTTCSGCGRSRPARSSGPDGYAYQTAWIHPDDAPGTRHRARRHHQGLQRAGRGPGRGLRHRTHHAGRHLRGPRRPVRPHRARRARPGRGHQHHHPAQHHLQERHRHGLGRLPGGRASASTSRRCAGSIRRPSLVPTTRLPASRGNGCWRSAGGALDVKAFVIDIRQVQRLLQLPGGLQGRARGQRLDAHRQAAARHRPLLDEGDRRGARARCPRCGCATCSTSASSATRRPAWPALQPGRHLQARRRHGHHRPGEVPRATGTAWTPAPTASSTSTTSCRSHRSAPAAPISSTRAGKSRAAWTPVPPGPSRSATKKTSRTSSPKRRRCKPEPDTKPRVTTSDLPNKCFIAGAVYDPEADECLEGATVTLTAPTGRARRLARDRRLRRLLVREAATGRVLAAYREGRLPGGDARPGRRGHRRQRRRYRASPGGDRLETSGDRRVGREPRASGARAPP